MKSAGLSATRCGLLPSALMTYTPEGEGPPSIASLVPSGDHDGIAEPPGSSEICVAPLPSEFAVKICETPLTVRENAILPLKRAVGVTTLEGTEGGPVPAL